jgi:hypothetical protein
VVSYRDDEVGAPLGELNGAVAGERRLDVALSGLAPADTAALIASMLGTDDVPPPFCARVCDEAGGNPYFIEEVLRGLMERGDVYLEAGRWAARTEPARLELPPTIAAVLERRLAAVPPDDRALLGWLAVYAQPMALRLLADASGLPREAVESGARRLAERQLVTLSDGECAQPAHDKLRELVYRREPQRARHLAIARALDRAGGEGNVFERAHHYWHAGDDLEARRWAERAARLGEETLAIDAAVDNYQRLRELAERRGDEPERRAATNRLLELCTVTGQYARIVAVCDGEIAARKEPLERARMHQMKGEALGGQGRLREGSDELRQATVLAGAPVPRGRRRRLFIAAHLVANLLRLRFGRRDLSVSVALDAGERARREIVARACFLLSVYAMVSGDDEGLGVSFAGLNAAWPLGRNDETLRLLQNTALCAHLLGRRREAERLMREAQRQAQTDLQRAQLVPTLVLARQLTQTPIVPEQPPVHTQEAELVSAIELLSTRGKALYAHMARGVAAAVVTQYALRFQYRPEVFRWADAMSGTLHVSAVQGTAAVMALIDGRKARAMAAWREAQRGDVTPLYRVWNQVRFGYACAVLGELDDARACLRAVYETLPAMEMRVGIAKWVPAYALVACLVLAARGDDERALLEACVARLERIRRAPAHLRFLCEAGRIALGRSSLKALERARDESEASWRVEPVLAGYPDGLLAAALALRANGHPSARAWSESASAVIEPRYPAGYAACVHALLGL